MNNKQVKVMRKIAKKHALSYNNGNLDSRPNSNNTGTVYQFNLDRNSEKYLMKVMKTAFKMCKREYKQDLIDLFSNHPKLVGLT
jgi:hypothetical protein